MAGPYAEGGDGALEGRRDGDLCGRAEGVHVRDMVVGSHADGDGAGVMLGDPAGGGGHGGRGIAALGLDDDEGLRPDLLELAADGVQVGLAGDDHRLRRALQPAHAQHRVLEQRSGAQQRQELLGPGGPRGRPQPRARASAQDHRNDGGTLGQACSPDSREAPACVRRALLRLPLA